MNLYSLLRLSMVLILLVTIGFLSLQLTQIGGSPLTFILQPSTENTPAATVSGAVRHDGSPVAGVAIQVHWESGSQQATTNASGAYSISGVPTGGWFQIFVRPPISLRLGYHNFGGQLSGDYTKDFDLVDGYRLQGEFRQPDGLAFTQSNWLGAIPLDFTCPPDEWLGETAFDGQFDLVLPPGRYLFSKDNVSFPYFMPLTKVDLRSGDVTGLVVTLLAERPPALPTTPPDASLISAGSADSQGIATVTGASGAVTPFSDVMVINLQSRSAAHAIAGADGSFSTSVFAPPGSTLLVKDDPEGWRTQGLLVELQSFSSGGGQLNPLPGTMITVGASSPGTGNTQAFTAAGGFVSELQWAGWWLSGSVQAPSGPPLRVEVGQEVRLNNLVLHVSSPAFNCSGTPAISVNMGVMLHSLFAGDGSPNPWDAYFMAYLYTPTGLPIEHEGGGQWIDVQNINFTDFTCDGAHAAASAPLQTSFTVPAGLPEGTYQIQAWLDTRDVPLADIAAAPFVVVWYYHAPRVVMPILTVGDALPPHIPWTLLGNYAFDGRRGVGAREDEGVYEMTHRVITQPERFIIPRVDARSGEALVYRLEPGSHWISATDRRSPNPPHVPLRPETGLLTVTVQKPDGSLDTLGPAVLSQTSQRTPTTASGSGISDGTGQVGDLYHLTTRSEAFDYSFDQYGHHVITLNGTVDDIYGRSYTIAGTYDVYVARILDLDPAQLPTTPYMQGDTFAPGLHVFPPVPAEVSCKVTLLPNSDPAQAVVTTIDGQANDYGYFQPFAGTKIRFDSSGEFRVDINAVYTDTDGTLWMGSQTWGSVIEGTDALIEAHGRRGMDYRSNTIDDMPAWFEVFNLPAEKVGIEVYYPYFNGDIHWGNEDRAPGDSIQSVVTIKDLTPGETIYNLMLTNYPRSRNGYRWPPEGYTLTGLLKRLDIGEAPLFLSTANGSDPGVFPEQIDQWAYWYASSERADVHVREVISEDNIGTAYWRFNDTYNMQIGEGALGDLPGDLKWEFGGAVFRVPGMGINEYAIYSSLWVLLPHGDAVGARVTPPFQFAAGGMNGGPIMTLNGKEIDMLFLPKGVRPGDVLEVGDTVSFSGHVGPPLDSRVDVTITSPSGIRHAASWHANKIGWLYDPNFDFVANEAGRWTVDVFVEHDRPYIPTGITPASHNTGTVLGTNGRYEFYVVEPGASKLFVFSPQSGFITWATGHIEPIYIHGIAPADTIAVYYTIHDKGLVMGQGSVTPDPDGTFTITYDARALNAIYPFVSLTAHEGVWEGLADEVEINLLAVGSDLRANTVTLIGEEVFTGSKVARSFLPLIGR